MRPWEWTTPEPVTRRDEVLARLTCDPPSSSHDRQATPTPADADDEESGLVGHFYTAARHD